MEHNTALDMQIREVLGKKVKRLRNQGMLPATVYGKGFGPVSVQLDQRDFNTTYRHVGRTALVELNIPGYTRQSAFIQSVQRHPISRSIIHADFHVVSLTEKMHLEVPIVLTGKSPLVERGDAVLNQTLATIEVSALPTDVPQHIDVDISGLDTLDKAIHVRDLGVHAKYELITADDELIVSLTPTRAAMAEGEEVVEEAAPTEPELIREERAEEEEDEK